VIRPLSKRLLVDANRRRDAGHDSIRMIEKQMIRLVDAINTGQWLLLKVKPHGLTENLINDGCDITLRFRVRGISELNGESVSDQDAMRRLANRNIWRLQLDVINICKREIETRFVTRRLSLAETNGHQYRAMSSTPIYDMSDAALSLGLRTFSNSCRLMPPKVVRSGSVSFDFSEVKIGRPRVLPFEIDVDPTDLYVSCYQGAIEAPSS